MERIGMDDHVDTNLALHTRWMGGGIEIRFWSWELGMVGGHLGCSLALAPPHRYISRQGSLRCL